MVRISIAIFCLFGSALLPAQVTVSGPLGRDHLVIDNAMGTPAYREFTGNFGQDLGQADSWNGDRRWSNGGGSGTSAKWTFDHLAVGTWAVYASWRTGSQANVTPEAPFTVSDGLGRVTVNMRAGKAGDLTLSDPSNRLVQFQKLGEVTVRDGSLEIELNDDASFSPLTYVFADAIAVRLVSGDLDNDGMPDEWELGNGLDATQDDGEGDLDQDGLNNLEEYERGTDPRSPDTDGDGLGDAVENVSGIWNGASDPGTNPLHHDSDGDGLPDGVENSDQPFVGPGQPGTDPNIADSDGDGFSDGVELTTGSHPVDPLSLPPVVAFSSNLSFNEIHYNPDGATSRTEFLEILNHGNDVVDLEGWQLDGGVRFRFPSLHLGPGEVVVVGESPQDLSTTYGVTSLGPWEGKLSNDGEEIVLRDGAGTRIDVVDYGVGFPWPTRASGGGSSMELLSSALDNDLGGAWRSSLGSSGGTPGKSNSVDGGLLPPLIRQVRHHPEEPGGNDPVLVTVKVTDPDGVDSVVLSHQMVVPGGYVALTNPAFEEGWSDLPMYDDGTNGDLFAGDATYSVVIPAGGHRTLVRYRITATDWAGEAVRVPYADDPQPNFAYFCYDGIPGWEGANEPGVDPIGQFSPEFMRQMPACHLLADALDIDRCQYQPSYRQVRFKGTLVHGGEV